MSDMQAPDGEIALREFKLAAIHLDDAEVGTDNDDDSIVRVSTTAHDGDTTISASHILDTVRQFDLQVTDVRGDFDADEIIVEVRPR